MCAGDDEGLAIGKEFVVEQGGHGGEGDAAVENAFDFRIAARERVADDDEVRGGLEVGFGVGFEDGNAEGPEQVSHGRIRGLVGAGDAMALELEKAGERCHGRAADAAEMNVTR